MDGIDRCTHHSVHAVARGPVEETPATFECHCQYCPGGNPSTGTACALCSRCWRSRSSSSSPASMSESSRYLPGCAEEWNSCVFCQKSTPTHTPHTAQAADAAYACAVVEKTTIPLCMSAAATDLPSCSVLFCPAVCLNRHSCRSSSSFHREFTYHNHNHISSQLLPLPIPVPSARLQYL